MPRTFPFVHPLQALNLLQSASPGPALPLGGLCRPRLSSSRPVQGQLLPPGGFCRPKSSSSRPPQAQLRPLGGLSGCKSSLSQPLQAQLLLPPSGLFRPSPAHASRRPSQAPLWTFGGLCRPRQGPASCLPKTCTGPASASQRTLHTQLALASLQPPESKAPASRPLRQAQLPPASGLFRPMGLIPHNSLSRPSFSLPAASLGREPPQVGLSRPTCTLRASSPGQAPLPGCISRPDSCLSTTSLDSVPTHLLAALAHSFLKPSSPGPGQASRWPLQDELLPSDGICRPQMVSGRWAPPHQAWASRRPLQAQVVLKSASPGPASQQVSKLFWLNSCPAPNRLCRPRTFSSQVLRA
nr:putative uncharacterized protein FLJ44672 [Gorilla gorilla gorilla]